MGPLLTGRALTEPWFGYGSLRSGRCSEVRLRPESGAPKPDHKISVVRTRLMIVVRLREIRQKLPDANLTLTARTEPRDEP